MFPSLTCWALQRSHWDRTASFSSHLLQMLLRVNPRMSFALFWWYLCILLLITECCCFYTLPFKLLSAPLGLGSFADWMYMFYSISQAFSENTDENQTKHRQRRKLGCFDLLYSWEILITCRDPGFWRTLCNGLPPCVYLSLGFIPFFPCNCWMLFKEI